MTKQELKDHVGKFGMIRAGEIGFKKTMHGTIKEMDGRGNIYFMDTEGYGFVFPPEQVNTFEPKEYQPFPDKYKGKEVYWHGGRVYYKESGRECDIIK